MTSWPEPYPRFPGDMEQSRARLVAVTGGPASGKTLVIRGFAQKHPDLCTTLLEAASLVLPSVPDWRLLDRSALRDLQIEIFERQISNEGAALRCGAPLVLCDRGTLDGLFFWLGAREEFWQRTGSSLSVQLERYDAVIWLESAAHIAGTYVLRPGRPESPDDARVQGQALRQIWAEHRCYREVQATPTMGEKYTNFLRALESVLPVYSS